MPLHTTTLQTVIARARAGQPDAIADLYAAYGDSLRRYCYTRLQDLNLAQDCVQDVFVHIWRGLPAFDYRNEAAFCGWMYTIANHVVVSHVRTMPRQQPVPLVPDLHDTEPAQADTARALIDRLVVRDAIGQLTPEQQQVIMLKFFEGWSNRQIAAALDRTEGAVKALQHRAIQQLHRLLTHDFVGGAPEHTVERVTLRSAQRSAKMDDEQVWQAC